MLLINQRQSVKFKTARVKTNLLSNILDCKGFDGGVFAQCFGKMLKNKGFHVVNSNYLRQLCCY